MIGLGSRVYASTDGSTYTELVGIKSTGAVSDNEVEQIEETPLNPTNRTREYVPGLIAPGRFSFMQFWTKARYDAYLSYLSNGTTLYWRVVSPDNSNPALASKWEFQGNLARWRTTGLQTTESIMIDAEVQITSAVTFTQGS